VAQPASYTIDTGGVLPWG